jgi:hypothetical protein
MDWSTESNARYISQRRWKRIIPWPLGDITQDFPLWRNQVPCIRASTRFAHSQQRRGDTYQAVPRRLIGWMFQCLRDISSRSHPCAISLRNEVAQPSRTRGHMPNDIQREATGTSRSGCSAKCGISIAASCIRHRSVFTSRQRSNATTRIYELFPWFHAYYMGHDPLCWS